MLVHIPFVLLLGPAKSYNYKYKTSKNDVKIFTQNTPNGTPGIRNYIQF